jgi:hypothetical protein
MGEGGCVGVWCGAARNEYVHCGWRDNGNMAAIAGGSQLNAARGKVVDVHDNTVLPSKQGLVAHVCEAHTFPVRTQTLSPGALRTKNT